MAAARYSENTAYLSRFISCREGKRHRITSTSRGRDIAANEVAMVSSVVENLRELLADDPDLDSAALLGKLLGAIFIIF